MRVVILAVTVAVVLASVGVAMPGHTAVQPPATTGVMTTTSSDGNVSLTAYAFDDSIQAGSNATIPFNVDDHEPNATVFVGSTNVRDTWRKVAIDEDSAAHELNASTAHGFQYEDVSDGTTVSPSLNAYVPSDAEPGEYTLTAVATAGTETVGTNIIINVSGGTGSSHGVLQEQEGGGNPSGACYYTEDYDEDLTPTSGNRTTSTGRLTTPTGKTRSSRSRVISTTS